MNDRIAAGSPYFDGRQRHAHRQQDSVLNPAGTCVRLREASEQEPGADEQHQRQRDFGDRPAAAPAGCGESPPRPLAAARPPAIAVRRARDGARPNDDAGHERRPEREREHAAVHLNLGAARQPASDGLARSTHQNARARLPSPPPASASTALSLHDPLVSPSGWRRAPRAPPPRASGPSRARAAGWRRWRRRSAARDRRRP